MEGTGRMNFNIEGGVGVVSHQKKGGDKRDIVKW